MKHQGRRLGPALIEAAQGTNSQNIGYFSAIVLSLGSKQVYFTPTSARVRSKSELPLLILTCGGLALAFSFFFREGSIKPAAPATFLLLIISVAHLWGRLASLLVTMVGGLVFAAFLFEPYGSLTVCNAADRIVLLLFTLSAVGVACLSRNSNTC
jgi:K+-sensing histidine kinase KdpD